MHMVSQSGYSRNYYISYPNQGAVQTSTQYIVVRIQYQGNNGLHIRPVYRDNLLILCYRLFLALLDYVKFIHRPSSARPYVSQLSLNLMHGFLSNSGCYFPRSHMLERFLNCWRKKKFVFFNFLFLFFFLGGGYILSLRFFTFFFFVFINMGPYVSKNFKTLLLPQITFKSFQTFSEFCSHKSTTVFFFCVCVFLIFKILCFWFLTNFWNLPFYSMAKPKTPIIWKKRDRRAKRDEIWVSGVSIQCIQGTFDNKCLISFGGHLVHSDFQ